MYDFIQILTLCGIHLVKPDFMHNMCAKNNQIPPMHSRQKSLNDLSNHAQSSKYYNWLVDASTPTMYSAAVSM